MLDITPRDIFTKIICGKYFIPLFISQTHPFFSLNFSPVKAEGRWVYFFWKRDSTYPLMTSHHSVDICGIDEDSRRKKLDIEKRELELLASKLFSRLFSFFFSWIKKKKGISCVLTYYLEKGSVWKVLLGVLEGGWLLDAEFWRIPMYSRSRSSEEAIRDLDFWRKYCGKTSLMEAVIFEYFFLMFFVLWSECALKASFMNIKLIVDFLVFADVLLKNSLCFL